MKYCRFENTYEALLECYDDIMFGRDFSELSESEQKYCKKLIGLCKKIANVDSEDILDEQS